MFGRVIYTPLTLNYIFFTVAYIFTTVTKSYNNASYITKIWLLFSQDITNSDIFNLGQDLTMKCISLCKIWQWFCLQQMSSEESITLYLMEFLKKNCAEPFARASFKEIWCSIKWNVYDVITFQIYELSSSNQQAASNDSSFTKSSFSRPNYSEFFLPYIDM